MTYYINRTQYPLGLSEEIWPAEYFFSFKILPVAYIFHTNFSWVHLI